MPFLLRLILQRLLAFSFTILAFFGINPDISTPTQLVIEDRKVVQEERVDKILQAHPVATSTPLIPVEPEIEVVNEVEKKITKIQKEFTETITQPLAQTAEIIVPPVIVVEPDALPVFGVKSVVVNIMCLEKTNTYTRLSSGSGVIITGSGIVLTNAHVTYPFLKTSQFDDSTYSCSVRRENIPNYGYNAELVYYPSDWLKRNKEIIKQASPTGTGEDDYALLRITSALGPVPKTSSFPHASVSITSRDLKKNLDVIAAGFPSSNSGVFEIDTTPGLKTALTQIKDYFTFGNSSYDILQTGVNDVAHRGASGGGIFKDDMLYGIVVTTNSNSDGSYINALTLPYIKKDFKEDTGFDFDSFIQDSAETMKSRFDSSFKSSLSEIISSN